MATIQLVLSPKAKTPQESLFKMQMAQRKGIDIYQSSTPWWELVSIEFSRLNNQDLREWDAEQRNFGEEEEFLWSCLRQASQSGALQRGLGVVMESGKTGGRWGEAPRMGRQQKGDVGDRQSELDQPWTALGLSFKWHEQSYTSCHLEFCPRILILYLWNFLGPLADGLEPIKL